MAQPPRGDSREIAIGAKSDVANTFVVLEANPTNKALKVDIEDTALPDGIATEAKQTDLLTELRLKADLTETQPVEEQGVATTPTLYNITLTSADTEYSQALPANTKEIRFRCQTLFDVRYAFVTGKVATPTAPYLTLPAGSDYYSDKNDLTSKTLYLATDEAGVIVELETWA